MNGGPRRKKYDSDKLSNEFTGELLFFFLIAIMIIIVSVCPQSYVIEGGAFPGKKGRKYLRHKKMF